jgi:RNA polymerase sigma-70 factor, ECF subfamily
MMSINDIHHDEDVRLMVALQHGRDEAFEALYRKHHLYLSRFFWHATLVPEIVDELIQDAFFRIHRYNHGFHPVRGFENYLHGVCRSVLATHWKRIRKLQHRRVENNSLFDHLRGTSLAVALVPELKELEDTYTHLSEKQRIAVLLVRLLEMDYSTAAGIMQVKPRSLRRLLGKARVTLEHHKSPELDDEVFHLLLSNRSVIPVLPHHEQSLTTLRGRIDEIELTIEVPDEDELQQRWKWMIPPVLVGIAGAIALVLFVLDPWNLIKVPERKPEGLAIESADGQSHLALDPMLAVPETASQASMLDNLETIELYQYLPCFEKYDLFLECGEVVPTALQSIQGEKDDVEPPTSAQRQQQILDHYWTYNRLPQEQKTRLLSSFGKFNMLPSKKRRKALNIYDKIVALPQSTQAQLWTDIRTLCTTPHPHL